MSSVIAGRRADAATGIGPFAWAILAAFGLALYVALVAWHSTDADIWFVPWTRTIIAEGAVHALAEPMRVTTEGATGYANYNPPYLYLLILGSLGADLLSPFAIVKIVAVTGALVCAACLYALLRTARPLRTSLAGAAGLLLLPTVLLNSAAWGQVDTIWAGLSVLAVAAALRERWVLMMAAFAAALAFKAQAVFLGPFLLYVVLAHRTAWRAVPVVVPVYVAFLLPAWLAGRPAMELATIYLDQANTYRWLSMNAPNPWAFVQVLRLMDVSTGLLVGFALAGTAGIALAALAVRVRLKGEDLLLLALTSATLMPFLLPKMLDRYFFLADILAYALAFLTRERWAVAAAIAIQIGSLGAYAAHMAGFLPGRFLGAAAMAVAVAILVRQLVRVVRRAGPVSARPPHRVSARSCG